MASKILKPEDGPPILYKYRNFDVNGLSSIIEGKLWFSSAREFNDPFDCAIEYDLSLTNKQAFNNWLEKSVEYKYPEMNSLEREKVFDSLSRNPELLERFKKKIIELRYDKYGICSLTKHRKNMLMWAHYANGHRGVLHWI